MQEWIEEAGATAHTRGLRGWAGRVYKHFETPSYHSKDRRKRVLALVSDAFGAGGGIAKFNRDLLGVMSASPAVSSVVAVTRVQPKPAQDLPLKLHYDIRGIGRDLHCLNGKLNFAREVIRLMRSYRQIDLVVCGLIGILPIAWLAARIKRVPLVCIIHGVDAWQADGSPIANRIIRHADGVIAVSQYTKQRFMEWSGVDANKVMLLPNCYDSIQYGPGPKPEYLLDRYGLQGKTVLMTLGRLAANEQYKGFDEIIECLPALAHKIPDIAYLVVGDGNDKQRLQEKVQALGLSDRVVFAGYIPEREKADHYRLVDAYVMPGRGEGFGIVYLEAMACGIPAVGSKLDGSRDALRNGMLGSLADPGNPEEIVTTILEGLKRNRGVVPDGLEYFSYGNFRNRCRRILDGIWTAERMRT